MTISKSPLVGAVDQGTTSTRFIVFDSDGTVVVSHQIEFTQYCSQPGWLEHDPMELVESVQTCIARAVDELPAKGYNVSDIQCIGITNQRETTILWDSETGKALHPAIVWSDGRTQSTAEKLVLEHGKDALQSICGLPITTYFSAVKARWMLDHVEVVREAYEQGRLCFGTVDTWLIHHLTGGLQGGVTVTDVTNASRTMLMDLHTLSWSETSLKLFGLEKLRLPTIVSSSQVYGNIVSGPLKGVPIAGCLGDQQAALVGQKCFGLGDAKNTYGTGCFLIFNTGTTPVQSQNGMLTSVAYQLGPNESPVYCLEGSVAVAGSAIRWLRDNIGLISSVQEVNDLAGRVKDSAGVYFVPALSGLFAPYWRPDARGTLCGLSQFTQREHIARATLESACYQTRAVLDAMNKDSKTALRSLNVDGGMSNSDLCMQIQADLIGLPIVRPAMRETTALGSAIAAGLAVGVWRSVQDLVKVNTKGQTVFEPSITAQRRKELYTGWEAAVERSFGRTTVLGDTQ